mmetsp:Transcript_60894/g.197032  ORF Transcript_60894/g.197032 Transcript_60894/m.197032 type:complete len:168 (-) Transcript_60894:401-904(-)
MSRVRERAGLAASHAWVPSSARGEVRKKHGCWSSMHWAQFALQPVRGDDERADRMGLDFEAVAMHICGIDFRTSQSAAFSWWRSGPHPCLEHDCRDPMPFPTSGRSPHFLLVFTLCCCSLASMSLQRTGSGTTSSMYIAFFCVGDGRLRLACIFGSGCAAGQQLRQP